MNIYETTDLKESRALAIFLSTLVKKEDKKSRI